MPRKRAGRQYRSRRSRTKAVAICQETGKVTVKLTKTEGMVLEQLVKLGWYRSKSHVLRQAMIELAERHKLKSDALVDIRIERNTHRPRRNKRLTGEEE